MPRESVTRPIAADDPRPRNWRVYVDGAPLEGVASVVIDHARLGTLTYGRTPQGYDGWTFHEEGGGGSVILPFARLDGQIHVGVVRQLRPNQGGEVWNAPRGFLDAGEDRRLGAVRELAEEIGLRSAAQVLALPGELANPNSTFFETWGPAEGVSFFAVEVDAGLLVRDEGGWTFRPGAVSSAPDDVRSRTAEAITDARFLPWWVAAGLGDLFTCAAVARLLAHLHGAAPG